MKLSEKARQWLEASYCFEDVSDDALTIANSGIVILLCKRAVEDLNRQARDADDDGVAGEATPCQLTECQGKPRCAPCVAMGLNAPGVGGADHD